MIHPRPQSGRKEFRIKVVVVKTKPCNRLGVTPPATPKSKTFPQSREVAALLGATVRKTKNKKWPPRGDPY